MLTFKSYASGSSGNLHTISDDKTKIIIDPGISWKKTREALGFKTSNISGVCVSHEHTDHCKSAKDAAMAGLDVYMLPETKKALRLNGHRIHEIKLKKTFQIGSIKVVSFPLQHDVSNCGFLFQGECGERAVYLTDTFYSRFVFPNINIIALEVNYSKRTISDDISPVYKQRLYKSHMSLENAIKLLKANDLSCVREIHLIHISKTNGDPERFKEVIMRETGKPTYV